MADRPILFSAPMVHALLDSRKTQTRRALNPQPAEGARFAGIEPDGSWMFSKGCFYGKIKPRYAPGDRVYVRETWAPLDALTHSDPGVQALADRGFYRADDGTVEGEISRWRPGIHMPRWASRLTLTVTDVRVQRLQEISAEDAKAEGVTDAESTKFTRVSQFKELWDTINSGRDDGAFAWSANPWICAVSFTVERRNIDEVAA